MTEWFTGLAPVAQALLAGLFTWSGTALGAALVFFFGRIDRRVMDAMLGCAAGIMIAASYWSLLAPAIEMSGTSGAGRWIPALAGFLGGGFFLWLFDKVLPHLHPEQPADHAEGLKTSWQRSVLLVMAITLHNIPEGLAVGVAFGAGSIGVPSATIGGALALAIGMAIQNFPEGAAVSVPLRREGMSRLRSFWYGQISAIVEPVAAVAGAAAVIHLRPILPYAMAFAAGAMIYVVVEELIPVAQQERTGDVATVGAMLGFALMMTLDVAMS